MFDQRLTERLIHSWTISCKDGTIPNYSQFNGASIPDIWNNCITLKIQPSAVGTVPKFQFHYVGDKVRTMFLKDPTGEYYTTGAKTFPTLRVLNKMLDILQNPIPMYDEGKFVNENSKVVKFRCALVPFGKEDGSITHIAAGISWREF